MTDFALGQRVRFTHTMSRINLYPERTITKTESFAGKEMERTYTINKAWESFQSPEREGLIMGKRTLSNGRHYWESESDGWGDTGYWVNEAIQHFTAYLVAFDLLRRPVLVLPEHITPLTQEES